MKLLKVFPVFFILISLCSSLSYSQPEYKISLSSRSSSRDTIIKNTGRPTINIGGIFIAPMLGAGYPIGKLGENSKGAFNYGFRLEYAGTKLYPFIISAFIELAKFPGKDEYKAQHLLDVFESKTVSFGGNVDILLSKYLKSNFTTPFVILEARMINVTRNATPVANVPSDIVLKESQLAYGGGAGFTLFIFDLSFKYLKSKSYSMVLFNTRFHIPLIKF